MNLKIFNFTTLGSTNNKAIEIIKKNKIKSGIVITNYQKKGRGRYNKKWISIKGNLFISIFFKINENKSIAKITKINCKLLKNALKNFVKKNIIIKSPNDLMIDKKKICGILQEIIFHEQDKYIIVGIGVNLVKSPQIKNYPTSHLSCYTNNNIDKKKIFLSIKKVFEKYYF